jgi:nucleotide-binding universal stress UspA family protein
MGTSMTNDQTPILVPLDGSELAERALPVAQRLAGALRRPLLLLRVIAITNWAYLPPGAVFPPQTYERLLQDADRAAEQYLREVAARAGGAGSAIHARTLRGDPAGAIIDTAREWPGTLIVIATHGRTGLARFAMGSVADRVVTYSRVPTLLVHPFGDAAAQARLERALVPLDGSETAERALPMVEQLAGDPLRQVTLVQVVDPERRAGETEQARQYLDAARQRLEGRLAGRTCAVATTLLYGRVDEQITEYAAREADLIIMGTHGRSGIDRWAYGSVASKVLRSAKMPLLLVHTLADA